MEHAAVNCNNMTMKYPAIPQTRDVIGCGFHVQNPWDAECGCGCGFVARSKLPAIIATVIELSYL